jgi:hypothetical protein
MEPCGFNLQVRSQLLHQRFRQRVSMGVADTAEQDSHGLATPVADLDDVEAASSRSSFSACFLP